MVEDPHELKGIGVDALSLLDQLEQVISDGRRIPLTTRTMVDAEELLELVADLRARLPQELREAKWLLMERDQILSEARTQASRAVEEARSRVASLADEAAVMKEAQAQAHEVIDKARHVAREIRYGALEFADKVLADASTALGRAAEQISGGRAELKISR